MTRRSSIVAQSKEAERDVARQLGGRRLHAGEWSGLGGAGDVDVLGPDWAAQVKHRAGVPAYVTEGFKQIRDAVAATQMIPVMVIRTKPGRGRQAETLVVLDAETWRRIKP